MNLGTIVTDAIATLTTQVGVAFTAVGPLILLIGGGFVAWKYAKRFLGKL